MTDYLQTCGIDVSKDTLDYCVLPKGAAGGFRPKTSQIPNTSDAIASSFGGEAFDNTLFVVESTGTYSSKALLGLSHLGRPVFHISPFRSRSFMLAEGVVSKNDSQAAYSLAQMGHSLKVRLYKPPTEQMQRRRQILGALRALEKQERMLCNQLHALEQLPLVEETAQEALGSALRTVRGEIAHLKEILNPLRLDKAFQQKMEYATSVKGIGEKTAEALLILTNNLETFDHFGQLAKFMGTVNWSHESGTSVRRKGGITKMGNAHVRGLLYMCTRSAIRHNLACKELYQRLRKNNKPYKVAAVAVMNKLLKQFFVCVKNEVMFDNEYYLKAKNR